MGYRNEIYKKALKIKNDEVKEAVSEYERRLDELRAKNPDFYSLELELAKLGPTIALAAIAGETDRFGEFKQKSDDLNAKYKKALSEANIQKPQCFCDKCEDSGFSDGDWCDCVKEIAKNLVADELSRYMPIGDCSFDTFKLSYYPDEARDDGCNPRKRASATFKFCKKYAENFSEKSKSILFMGETGLGKTHLSLSIVSEVSKKGFSVVYGPVGKLFSEVEKEHFSGSSDTEKLDRLLECDLLVMDDLGTEFLTPFTSSLFYNIINSRLLEGRPTIVSTNLNIDEIEARYTQRIASRFIGNYDVRLLIGSDIRQQKIMNNKKTCK